MRVFTPENAKTIPEEAKKVFTGELFDVYQWPQEMFDGSTATFEMLKRSDTVRIIAIRETSEGPKVVFTKQRQPRKDWFYDYPGGRVDAEDTNELAAAKRELLEETGYNFRNWKLIRVRQPFSKIDWLVYTFLATDFIEKVDQKLDSGEEIEVMEVDLAEAVELLSDPASKMWDADFDNLEYLKKLPALYKYN